RDPFERRQADHEAPGDAFEDVFAGGMSDEGAVPDAEEIRTRPFRQHAVPYEDRFESPRLFRLLLGEDVRQEADRLDVAAEPADVGYGDAGDPRLPHRLLRPGKGPGDHEDRRIDALGKEVVAGGDSPAHLHVEGAVVDRVSLDELETRLL